MASNSDLTDIDEYQTALMSVLERENPHILFSEEFNKEFLEIIKNALKIADYAKSQKEQLHSILTVLNERLSKAESQFYLHTKKMQENIEKMRQDLLESEKKNQVEIKSKELDKFSSDHLTKLNLLEEKISKIDSRQKEIEKEYHLLKTNNETHHFEMNILKTNVDQFQAYFQKINDDINDLHYKQDQMKNDSLKVKKNNEDNATTLQELQKTFNKLEKENFNLKHQSQNENLEQNIEYYKILKNIEILQSEQNILKETGKIYNTNCKMQSNKLTEICEEFKKGHNSEMKSIQQKIDKIQLELHTSKNQCDGMDYFTNKILVLEDSNKQINLQLQKYKKLINNISQNKDDWAQKSINTFNELLTSSLIQAVEEGQMDILPFIINLGADVNSKGFYMRTPLHYAAIKGDVSIVTELIKNNADIDSKDEGEWTPLHCAAMHGHLDVVIELMKNNANASSEDKYKKTPLHYAHSCGHVLVVTELIKNRASFEPKDKSLALIEASKEGQLDYLAFIIRQGTDVNCKGDEDRTPLHYASIKGHSAVVSELLRNKANIECKDEEGMTPLHYAASKGHLSVVTTLIKNKANIENTDKNNYTALHWASMNGHVSVVSALVENKANIESKNKEGLTPIHSAALKGHAPVVIRLIKHNADIESRDQYGKTALQCASLNGHVSVVRELIKNNANIESKNVDGKSSLDLAVQHKQAEVINILQNIML